ncbi:MAG TPA: hypothetical protein VKP58_12855 [Candidatus Acidoferrum sp.]|nr:hypothetical protein [Candidatus Acidoferrum sp.]
MSAKALLGILLGIFLLVYVVFRSLPKSGKTALEAEVAAMNGVQSWRIQTEVHGMGGVVTRTHVAICPDREHIVEEGRGAASEYIRIGDDIYYRRGVSDWKRGMPNGSYFFAQILTARPCLTNPKPYTNEADGAEELRQWIAEDMKLGRIVKGEMKFENDESCREWTVKREAPGQPRQEYVVCIGELDHLPRAMKASNGALETRYTWNPPVTIEAPDMNSAPAATPVL